MRGSQYGGNRETDQEAFERLLKSSNHFRDVINSHRQATAQMSAQVFGLLIAAGQLQAKDVMEALHRLELEPGKPSEGSARRLAIAMVRDELQAMPMNSRNPVKT